MQGHGFDPWSGKIPHATEQLSLRATSTEARALQQEKPPQWKAHALQLEKALVQQQRPTTANKENK